MINFKPFCFVSPPQIILVASVKAQKHVRLDQGFLFLNNQLAQKQSNTDNTDWYLWVPLPAASCAGRFKI